MRKKLDRCFKVLFFLFSKTADQVQIFNIYCQLVPFERRDPGNVKSIKFAFSLSSQRVMARIQKSVVVCQINFAELFNDLNFFGGIGQNYEPGFRKSIPAPG